MPDGDALDGDNHILRNAALNKLQTDPDDDAIVWGLSPAAFELRPADDGAMSTTWIQYFDGDLCAKVTSAVQATRRTFKCGAKSAYGIAKASDIQQVAGHFGVMARILIDEVEGNKAHTVVRRIDFSNLELRTRLAADAFTSFVRDAAILKEVG